MSGCYNTTLGSPLVKILSVLVETILSNQGGTSFMIARGLMGIGTLEEIRSVILSCS